MKKDIYGYSRGLKRRKGKDVPVKSGGHCVNAQGTTIPCSSLLTPCTEYIDARGISHTNCASPRASTIAKQPFWALEGIGNLRDCCSIGSLGCCDMVAKVGGYMSGLGEADADLTQKVQSTLNMMPGASSTVADQSTVGMLYDVLTGATAERLDRELSDYKRKVAYLNESLRKIDARRDDLALRTKLLAEHAKVAKSVGNYGKALIDQINHYNEMIDKFSGTVAGKITMPDTVPVTGIPKLDVPTLSGFGDLGLAWAPVVLVGIIALLLWKFGDVIQDAMHYDLKTKGFKEGMDREYEGFTGMINKQLEKLGGSMLTTALLLGGGVVAFLLIKNYMAKKGVIASTPAKAAVKEIEAVAGTTPKAAGPEPTAKEAVKEISSIAQGA